MADAVGGGHWRWQLGCQGRRTRTSRPSVGIVCGSSVAEAGRAGARPDWRSHPDSRVAQSQDLDVLIVIWHCVALVSKQRVDAFRGLCSRFEWLLCAWRFSDGRANHSRAGATAPLDAHASGQQPDRRCSRPAASSGDFLWRCGPRTQIPAQFQPSG